MSTSQLETLTAVIPGIVSILYCATGICYLCKKDFAWALVWLSYALANFGVIIVGLRK